MQAVAFFFGMPGVSIFVSVAFDQDFSAAAFALETDFVAMAEGCAVFFVAHRAPEFGRGGHIYFGCGIEG